MSDNFYNTIKEAGELLESSKTKANAQNLLILQHFLDHPGCTFTPFEVQDHIGQLKSAPITSIRRGMTDLTNDGFIIKTDILRMERLGKSNHCWKLNTEKCRRGVDVIEDNLPI